MASSHLRACTLGSALGPTLGNEYGRTLPFYVVQKMGFLSNRAPVGQKKPQNRLSNLNAGVHHATTARHKKTTMLYQ